MIIFEAIIKSLLPRFY